MKDLCDRELSGDFPLKSLTVAQLEDVSLGLIAAYDFEVFISGGRFWLRRLGDRGGMMLRPNQTVNEIFASAKAASEFLESLINE